MFTEKIVAPFKSDVALTAYVIDSFSANKEGYVRPAVVVLPGGGYGMVSKREGEAVALRFASKGYHAFLLEYTVNRDKDKKAALNGQPLVDVSWAVSVIRKNAAQFFIDPDKIAVCGFSAGGHLAASLGVLHSEQGILDRLNLQPGDNKPNALILAYPVITGGEFAHKASFLNLLGQDSTPESHQMMSLERYVSAETPPTFLWHTVEDAVVPVENSLLFVQALRKHAVPFEAHFFEKGRHGYSLATKETSSENHPADGHIAKWFDLCADWLGDRFGV